MSNDSFRARKLPGVPDQSREERGVSGDLGIVAVPGGAQTPRSTVSTYTAHSDLCPGGSCRSCGAHFCDEDGAYCDDCTEERKADSARDTKGDADFDYARGN